jgi:translation initiation factor 1
MKKNKSSNENGLVYSTNKEYMNDYFSQLVHLSSSEKIEEEKQNLIVRLETKHRAGKAVTVILNFIGNEDEMNDLCKFLKTKCGTGGSVKDGEILIQGDFRDKVCKLLQEKKYKAKRGN